MCTIISSLFKLSQLTLKYVSPHSKTIEEREMPFKLGIPFVKFINNSELQISYFLDFLSAWAKIFT